MASISVLLPCYNGEATLETALASLEAQTLTDFEVVAVDDGSTDNTLAILKNRSRRDKRFCALSRSHRGLIETLNDGLAACSAPYIARMDADDRAYPERLARQVAYLDTHPEIAVVGCLVQGVPKGQVRKGFQIYINWINSLTNDDDIRREIFVESPLVHPSVAFRKSWVAEVGGYQDHGWAEDYDLWLRLYLAGARFAKIPLVLLDWLEHPGRMTRTDPRYSVENFLRAKAYYLAQGPIQGRDAVLIWGAGMMGRRLSKHLLKQNAPLVAFVDIDPRKIGRTRRGRPIHSPEDLPGLWKQHHNPILLAAVGARGARALIRERLNQFGFIEAQDWWSVA
jgi:glycosyltransferase involved in cell wall biosynthesis